ARRQPSRPRPSSRRRPGGRPSPCRRSRLRCWRSAERSHRARGCTGPPWPPCCPPPCSASPVGSLRSLHDLHHAPALGFRDRTRLHDAHGVAQVSIVRLVVRRELGRPSNGLAVEGVSNVAVDAHDDRLIHLVRDDDTGSDLAGATLHRLGVLVAHGSSSTTIVSVSISSSRSRSTVLTRARSWRTCLSREGSSS